MTLLRSCRITVAALAIFALLVGDAFATLRFSTTVRNARLDAIESSIGTSAVIKIYTGAQEGGCANATSGTLLATISMASDWGAGASSGTKILNSLPLSTTASGTGTAQHFRIFASDGTTCHIEGSITATGGGGDMTVDNTSLASGQTFSITAFTLTEGNS